MRRGRGASGCPRVAGMTTIERLWSPKVNKRTNGQKKVTGANSRARACTKVCVAGAKLSQKNHLQAGQLLRTRQIVVLAREFAPVTQIPKFCPLCDNLPYWWCKIYHKYSNTRSVYSDYGALY